MRKGDSVRVVSGYKDLIGKEGVLLESPSDADNCPWVEFKQYIGHLYEIYDAGGMGENGYCYPIVITELELIESQPTLADIISKLDEILNELKSNK